MIINELGVKEVNEYYARKGGRRTANISNFANYMQKASLKRSAPAQTAAGVQAEQEVQTGQESAEKTESRDVCCEQCRLTGRLLLQMMSRNLYSQSSLLLPGTFL